MKSNLLILILFFLYGCDKFEKKQSNQPPNEFKVVVSKTSANTAFVDWEKAIDPESDEITYSVYLNDVEISINLRNVFHQEFKGLESEKTYSGFVTATDSKNNTTRVPFSFVTRKNSAPENFDVAVTKIKQDYALIEWTASNDIDNDSITYAIVLNGVEIASNIQRKYNYEFTDLNPETSYQGAVIARDSKNNEKIVPFSYKTLKYYLRYSKLINIGNYTISAFSIDKTQDGGYILGCTALIVGNDLHYILAIKVDYQANIEWYSMIPVLEQAIPVGDVKIKQTKDNGYLVVALKKILKLNAKGEVVWQYTLQKDIRNGGVGFTSFIQSDDNGFVVVGSYLLSTPQVLIQGQMMKFDENGSLQWEKLFGSAYRTYCFDIVNTIDGNFAVVGTIGDDNNSELFVNKFGPQGNLLWNRVYDNSEKLNEFPRQIKVDKNNDLLITGSSVGLRDINDARVLKISDNGSLIWDKYFRWDSFITVAYAIEPTDASGCVFTGWNRLTEPRGCILVKLNSNGILEWNRYFVPLRCDWDGRDLESAGDGGFVVLGHKGCVWNNNGVETGVWIFKTDPEGFYEN